MKNSFFLFLFLLTPLWGEETVIDMAQDGQTYNYWGEFVNMLFTLAFVIVLIIASVWLLKKIMRSKVRALNASNGIKILEKRILGPKTALYLVDILGKGIVISDSQAGVQLICEFPDSINIEKQLEELQEEKQPRIPLHETLINKLKKKHA